MDIHSTTVPFALIKELAEVHGVSPSDGKHAVKAAIAYKRNEGAIVMTFDEWMIYGQRFYKGEHA